jgi:hypothetical protein
MRRFLKYDSGFNLNLTKNKSIEVEWDHSEWVEWFYLSVGTRSGDHRGFEFSVSLFKANFSIKFYDHRHRNRDG